MWRMFFARLAGTLWPEKRERQLREDFAEHLTELEARESARGTGAAEARLAARLEFGSIELAKETYRDQARFRGVENVLRDVRFAFRQSRKNPSFTATAVLSLAIGIGANTALFSFANALLLKRLPVLGADRLVLLKSDGKPMFLSYDQVNELNRQATELDGLLGSYILDVSALFGDRPQWVSAELVTGEYFQTLQIKPERGRLLTQKDMDDAQGNPVCVISDNLWRREFAGAPDVIGQTIQINMRRYRIVGVTSSSFTGADLQRPSDLEVPATRLPDFMPAFAGNTKFDWKSRLSLFFGIARLRPSAKRASAAAELTRLNRMYHKRSKLDNHTADVQLVDGSGGLRSSQGLARPVSILLAVSLLVLLIACANLATLLLSRISARSSEFALRLAIGGSRGRILAQVLVESALLAAFGTALGIAFAYAIQRVLLSFLNRTAPSIHQLHADIDGKVLAFAAVTSALCVLLFGAAPALRAARTVALGSSAGNTRGGQAIRKTFVVVQIALSFVVVLSAGLLTGTLRNLKTLPLGYRPEEIAAIDIRPATGGYTGVRADEFYARLVDRIRDLPGIEAAATAFGVNLEGGFTMNLKAQGESGAGQAVNVVGVGPGYFHTFGAHILAGRDFDARDTPGKPQVYVISEHLAKKYFREEDPVGRDLLSDEGRKLRIIGVVSDIRDQNLRDGAPGTVYQAASQLLASSLAVFVRCHGPCQSLLPTLQTAVRSIDPNTPILAIHTMRTEIEGTFSAEAALGFLSTLFAALAMLLTGTGLYGVLSYSLTRRRREVGVRIAVGASAIDIVALFAWEAATMIFTGMLIGIPAALAAVTLLKSQLFGVKPHDPGTLAACVLCVLAVIIVASIAPIRRALRIAPQQALRIE